MHSPPFIFSRFQSGKQIHTPKYLVLAGGKGSFFLIKNKLSRAPSRSPLRSPLFSLRLPPAAGGAGWSLGLSGKIRAVAEASPPSRTRQSLGGRSPISLRWGYQNICFSLKGNININKRLASAARFLPLPPRQKSSSGSPWRSLNPRTRSSAPSR